MSNIELQHFPKLGEEQLLVQIGGIAAWDTKTTFIGHIPIARNKVMLRPVLIDVTEWWLHLGYS